MAVPPVQSVSTLPGVGGLAGPAPAPGSAGGTGFAGIVGAQLENVQALEQDAAAQSRAVATGTSNDLAAALVSVERADLALQLTTQLRNKAVEAYQEVLRMQV